MGSVNNKDVGHILHEEDHTFHHHRTLVQEEDDEVRNNHHNMVQGQSIHNMDDLEVQNSNPFLFIFYFYIPRRANGTVGVVDAVSGIETLALIDGALALV